MTLTPAQEDVVAALAEARAEIRRLRGELVAAFNLSERAVASLKQTSPQAGTARLLMSKCSARLAAAHLASVLRAAPEPPK